MLRAAWLSVMVMVVSSVAFAQGEEPRVIVVPVPGEATPDAGVAQPPPPPAPTANPLPPPPPVDTQVIVPPPNDTPTQPQGDTTLQAVTPDTGPLAPEVPPAALPPPPPGAMIDGHPREGAFLSGPGSLAFVLHHTLMGSLGALSTQMVPRLIDWGNGLNPDPFGQDARLAYLAAGLIGAGVGFGAAAWWQFNHWISANTATLTLLDSIWGAMFFIGLTNLFTTDANWVSWLGLIGAEIGAWVTTIVGGGDVATNHLLLITSGAGWAAIYAALILAIVATTGNSGNARQGIDALLLAPAIGAGAMSLALLKFNPSSAQILRADLFGAGVGAAVLLVSALVLGAKFDVPTPYILAGIGAAGAITTVSLLWAEAAEAPAGDGEKKQTWLYRDPEKDKPYSTVWW